MEEKRSKTLDALSTFIQSQRTLLAKTNDDIQRLKQLRDEVASYPSDDEDIVPHFLPQIASTSRLSEQAEITATLPADFDWSLFASQDPAPFEAFTSTLDPRIGPVKDERPTLTPLQQLVRGGRKAIVDPVLASYPPLSSDEEDEPPDPEELKKILEREKIRDLKKRRIDGGSGYSGLGLRRSQAYDGVHIRRDQEDESAEVDIWGASQEVTCPTPRRDPKTTLSVSTTGPCVPMEVDTPPTSIVESPISLETPPQTLEPPDLSRSGRARRPTRKAAEGVRGQRISKAKGKEKPENVPAAMPEEVVEAVPAPENNLDKRGKPRPETYKQAWSVSEQHLLERLLEEIPEGEKNRWAKISKAMNGRRTARQVASRVQKYFEKLKRFGVEVGKS